MDRHTQQFMQALAETINRAALVLPTSPDAAPAWAQAAPGQPIPKEMEPEEPQPQPEKGEE